MQCIVPECGRPTCGQFCDKHLFCTSTTKDAKFNVCCYSLFCTEIVTHSYRSTTFNGLCTIHANELASKIPHIIKTKYDPLLPYMCRFCTKRAYFSNGRVPQTCERHVLPNYTDIRLPKKVKERKFRPPKICKPKVEKKKKPAISPEIAALSKANKYRLNRVLKLNRCMEETIKKYL